MARNNDRDRASNNKRAPKDDKRRPMKKKASPIAEGTYIDYKDINLLRKFTSDRGKIRARRVTGLSVQMQRDVANAVKNARELALLPFAATGVAERGPRRPRQGRPDADADPELNDQENELDVDDDGDDADDESED
jgi:small subunit ribosomal protein S18